MFAKLCVEILCLLRQILIAFSFFAFFNYKIPQYMQNILHDIAPSIWDFKVLILIKACSKII